MFDNDEISKKEEIKKKKLWFHVKKKIIVGERGNEVKIGKGNISVKINLWYCASQSHDDRFLSQDNRFYFILHNVC